MFLIQQPPHPCDSKQQQQQQPTGEKPPLRSLMSGLALPATSDPSLPQDGGEIVGTRTGEQGRGPVWLSPNGASCGYPSNTDYYVVPPLTLMGCYNDLKWFNGSQVGAPNGPLYTPMRIMNGNDSVVKCLCFSGFLFSLFFLSCCSGSVTGVVLCGDRAADTAVDGWRTPYRRP